MTGNLLVSQEYGKYNKNNVIYRDNTAIKNWQETGLPISSHR